MSNSNVTIFNGTFRKLNGETRTMRFIRKSDLPASMVNEATISNLEGKTHSEVVYDVDKRGFRQFNWKTAEGEVTETPIKKTPSFGLLFPALEGLSSGFL